jgi:hypothetical protein
LRWVVAAIVGAVVVPAHVEAEICPVNQEVHIGCGHSIAPRRPVDMEAKFSHVPTMSVEDIGIPYQTNEIEFLASDYPFFCRSIDDSVPKRHSHMRPEKTITHIVLHYSDILKLWTIGWSIKGNHFPAHFLNGSAATIFEDEVNSPILKRTITITKRRQRNVGGVDEGALDGFCQIVGVLSDFSLSFHNAGLSEVDYYLRDSNRDEGDREDYLGPMRPYRGLPMALGWAVIAIPAWIWLARHDYDGLALVLLVTGFVGAYGILIAFGGGFTIAAPHNLADRP